MLTELLNCPVSISNEVRSPVTMVMGTKESQPKIYLITSPSYFQGCLIVEDEFVNPVQPLGYLGCRAR